MQKFFGGTREIKPWVWITIQAILFSLLIFADFSRDLEATTMTTNIARALEGLALAILFVSIYNLRQSLNIAPQPVNNGELQSGGIYKYIRHPMYTAVFLVTTGIALNSGSYWKFVVALLIIIFFRVKTQYEEGLLKAKYPGYKKYMKSTGRYFPVFHR